jgi:threonyl-tRNA synthetase
VGEDNQKHRPAMIHRVILGSLERFIGVLIEHHAGAFPLWLAPVQVILLTVTDRTQPFTQGAWRELLNAGIRAQQDTRNEKLGLKIREAQLQKIPYMLVIGDKEAKTRTVSPRRRSGEQMEPMGLDTFIQLIRKESDPYRSKVIG